MPLAPEVSVVLPAFNRLQYLREAVDSVLAQTHTDWELIVADDGSDQDTRAYLSGISDERLVLLWLPHSGNPAAVRNHAIRRARGRYVAFLDSDDVWAPRKLEIQLGVMQARPDRRWSYTNAILTDESARPSPEADSDRGALYEGRIVEPLLKLVTNIATATVVAERSLVNEVAGFDEEQRYCEDCDLWIRLALLSEVTVTHQPLARIRNHHVDRYSLDRLGEYHGWLQLFGKMARLVPDSDLRSLCQSKRAEVALVLAGLYFDRGDHAASARTVIASSRFSWSRPEWWWGAVKALLRPIVPLPFLAMYRRR